MTGTSSADTPATCSSPARPGAASVVTAAIERRRAAGELAFIPFITAGDPNLATTTTLLKQLSARGADIIEVGFPYSDPIADGPVIQSSYVRALNAKLKTTEIFDAVASVRSEVACPMLAMVSYALVFRRGPQEFLHRAKSAGFNGLIVPDLPGDQSESFMEACDACQLDLIPLIAPTTPVERSGRILRHARGFVYCIAVAGTTGVREALPQELEAMLARLRPQTSLPLAVGFGLSRPEQIRALAGRADGAIIGSALVRHLEKLPAPEAIPDLLALADRLAAAAHAPA